MIESAEKGKPSMPRCCTTQNERTQREKNVETRNPFLRTSLMFYFFKTKRFAVFWCFLFIHLLLFSACASFKLSQRCNKHVKEIAKTRNSKKQIIKNKNSSLAQRDNRQTQANGTKCIKAKRKRANRI